MYFGVSGKQYQNTSKEILKMLEKKGMTTKEVKKTLKSDLNISAILNLMCDQGLIIRGMPKGGWRSNIHTYYPFKTYFPGIDLKSVEHSKAKRRVVEKYISSFGPVSVNDISWWTGFPKRDVKRIIDSLEKKLVHVEIEGLEKESILLSSDLELIGTNKEINLVNFLPSLDPYIMGYKDRERYLDKERYYNVFDRSGNATNTILFNGRVIGIWDFEEKPKPVLKIHVFEDIRKNLKRGILFKAYNLGRFIVDGEVNIKEYDEMTPLDQRTAGGFMRPLKDL
jgi:hypothetical protein